jgi:hypothetical protein
MLRSACVTGLVVAVGLSGPLKPCHAQAPVCERVDFETVVDAASDTLRDLNQQNTAVFQTKLRQLKDKRGWSHDQFLKEGAPFVADEKIAAFNDKSEDLLARINGSGASSGSAEKPDCTVLASLRATMRDLVETQTEKWVYMFAKIDAELGK